MTVDPSAVPKETFTASDGTKFTDKGKYRRYMMKLNYTFEKQTGKRGALALTKAPGSIAGQPFDILDIDDCEIRVLCHSSQAQVDRVKNSKVFVGPVESSIFVRDCENCEFTIACRQLRTRDCKNCTFNLLSCTTLSSKGPPTSLLHRSTVHTTACASTARRLAWTPTIIIGVRSLTLTRMVTEAMVSPIHTTSSVKTLSRSSA